MTFEAALPADLDAVVAALRRAAAGVAGGGR
jgi:hypothetical protein